MPTTLDRVTGMRLRDIREMRGYTQTELAFALDVTSSMIRLWEKGRSKLTAARIDQLARSLDVPPAALLEPPGSRVKPRGARVMPRPSGRPPAS